MSDSSHPMQPLVTDEKGNRIKTLQGIVDHLNGRVQDLTNTNADLMQLSQKKSMEIKELKSRAIRAEEALNPTKTSLEKLTAEKSRWMKKIKRLEGKK